MSIIEILITIFCSVFASSGFWMAIQKATDKQTAKTRMILGLGHDRIIHLCKKYIDAGWISAEDYEDLYEYLFKPYEDMGGNGTAHRLIDEVSKLPMHKPEP